ncbi:MAG: hypothetical protein IJQ85_08630 [Selenomonadaceae bacterium]|nr:hypothetical protein [Selenomonadaceae bacterium]
MKAISDKIAEDFGKACYKKNVVGVCIALNESNNTNSIAVNASGYEAGFLIRQLIQNLSNVFSDSAEDYNRFCDEISKLDLSKKA